MIPYSQGKLNFDHGAEGNAATRPTSLPIWLEQPGSNLATAHLKCSAIHFRHLLPTQVSSICGTEVRY